MRLRVPQEREERRNRLSLKDKSRNGTKIPNPMMAGEALAKDGGQLEGLNPPSKMRLGLITSLQEHLGNAWVQKIMEEVETNKGGRRNSVRESNNPRVPRVQLQGEEREAEEPPESKDPKAILEKALRDWQQTEEGKKNLALLKAAGVKKEKPEEKILRGAASILAAIVANEMKIPQKVFDLIPEIELGEDVKLKIKPIWKGTLGKPPKEWGGTVTLTIKW